MYRVKPLSLAILSLLGASGCVRERAGTERVVSDLFPSGGQEEARSVDESWEVAVSPWQFKFPEDHRAHEDYRIEWWYYTGNLVSEDGERFGYQLTFFRTGLHKTPRNPSKWAVRDLYTAHFAVSDIGSEIHHCFQRNSRRGVGQAGVNLPSYAVWNGDWRAWLAGEDHRLQAAQADVSIDLTLSPTKPPVLHGDHGLSQKGPSVGNASYYYSLSRLTTSGTVTMGDKSLVIRGSSWMDHEFSSSFLESGQLGWDWFALQLDNGVDLMLYRMRREDGTTDPHSSGTVIGEEGVAQHLSAKEFRLKPLDNWESPETGAKYPLRWSVQVPALGYQLEVRPLFAAQEMTTRDTTGISYWEGAVEVLGESADGRIGGRGYMELTGYEGLGLGSLLN